MNTLTYEAFVPEVRMAVQKASPDDVSVSVQSIRKNNGVNLDALVISKSDCTTAPTIYINPYYEEDHQNGSMSVEEIADRIILQYQNASLDSDFDVSDFSDYEKIKNRIVMKLVSKCMNKELLAEIPHVDYLDLAITFCILLETKDHGNASILIKNEHLDIWQRGTEEIFARAKDNSPKLQPMKFSSMGEILSGMISDPDEDMSSDSVPLYVLSNKDNVFGATVILYEGTLKEIYSRIGSFWVIPSSIHECLCVPDSENVDRNSLDQMIVSVNGSAVDAQEVLSDHCYRYNAETGHLEIP